MRIFWVLAIAAFVSGALNAPALAGRDVWSFDQDNPTTGPNRLISATNQTAGYQATIAYRVETQDWMFLGAFAGHIPVTKLFVFPHDAAGNGSWFSFDSSDYRVIYENNLTIVTLQISESFLSRLQSAHAIQFFSDGNGVVVSLKGSRAAIDDIRAQISSAQPSGLSTSEFVAAMMSCDAMASHPEDREGSFFNDGVSWADLDVERALTACLTAAGNDADLLPRLSYQIGRILVKAKDPKALGYLRAAEAKGYIAAIYQLGILYEQGRMLDKDPQQALSRYQQGAKTGHLPSMYRAAKLLVEEFEVEGATFDGAAEMMKQTSDAGYRFASLQLGIWHVQQAFGDSSPATARQYFTLGWRQGSADSAFRLAHLFRDGIGGAVQYGDYIAALKSAAAMGHALARKELAELQ